MSTTGVAPCREHSRLVYLGDARKRAEELESWLNDPDMHGHGPLPTVVSVAGPQSWGMLSTFLKWRRSDGQVDSFFSRRSGENDFIQFVGYRKWPNHGAFGIYVCYQSFPFCQTCILYRSIWVIYHLLPIKHLLNGIAQGYLLLGAQQMQKF